MGIKKQAVNDATELFQKNIDFWELYDKTIIKAQNNPKYDEIFGNVYNDLLKKKTGNESALIARAEKAVKLRPSRTGIVIAGIMIATGVIYVNGWDKVLLEKGQQRVRRGKLWVSAVKEDPEKFGNDVGKAAGNVVGPVVAKTAQVLGVEDQVLGTLDNTVNKLQRRGDRLQTDAIAKAEGLVDPTPLGYDDPSYEAPNADQD